MRPTVAPPRRSRTARDDHTRQGGRQRAPHGAAQHADQPDRLVAGAFPPHRRTVAPPPRAQSVVGRGRGRGAGRGPVVARALAGVASDHDSDLPGLPGSARHGSPRRRYRAPAGHGRSCAGVRSTFDAPSPGAASRPPVAIPPAAPPPVARPPADPRVEIKALIGDYARALESRDLAEIRRVYPGLTSAEQGTFSQFFESVTDLKAGLTINRLIIAG